MANVREYVGARYVPLFSDPLEWDGSKAYEPLTIVLHQGNSYTSRQYVPENVDIANETFWALTGNYNAQIEQYRLEVGRLDNRIEENKANIADNAAKIASIGNRTAFVFSVKDYGATGDGATDDTNAIKAAVNAAIASITDNQTFITNTGSAVNATVFFPAGVYLISDTITIPQSQISYSSLTYQSNVRLKGAGKDVSVLKFTDSTKDGIRISGANSGVTDMSIIGSLNGIHVKSANAGGFCPYGDFADLHMNGCANAALLLENVYVTNVSRVIARAGNGIVATGEGTSLNISNCYMMPLNSGAGVGYHIEDYVYSAIRDCQTDGMLIGYDFATGNTAIKRCSIAIENCGCERPYKYFINFGNYDYLDAKVDMFTFTGNSNNAASLVSTGNYGSYCNILFSKPFINSVGTTIVFDSNENAVNSSLSKIIKIEDMATIPAITNLLSSKNRYFYPMQYRYFSNAISATADKPVMQFNEAYRGDIEVTIFRNSDGRYIKKHIAIDMNNAVKELYSFTENPAVDVAYTYDGATNTLKVHRSVGSADLIDFSCYAKPLKANTGFKMLDGVAE